MQLRDSRATCHAELDAKQYQLSPEATCWRDEACSRISQSDVNLILPSLQLAMERDEPRNQCQILVALH